MKILLRKKVVVKRRQKFNDLILSYIFKDFRYNYNKNDLYLSYSISGRFPPTLFPWHIGSAVKSGIFICRYHQLFATFVGLSHYSVALVLATTTAGIDHGRTEAQQANH